MSKVLTNNTQEYIQEIKNTQKQLNICPKKK